MRKVALTLTLGGFCLLALLCAAGVLLAQEREGADLVLPGAADVRIDGRGTGRLHISYRFPADRQIHNLRDFLLQQGWRHVRTQSFDNAELIFARRGLFGLTREIALVTLDPAQRAVVDIQVARCLRIASWTSCSR